MEVVNTVAQRKDSRESSFTCENIDEMEKLDYTFFATYCIIFSTMQKCLQFLF